MEVIWAPWRMAYIENTEKKDQNCFFCLPQNHIGPDKNRLLLYSDPLVLVMMNLYPYNNGHLLIAPRRHVATLSNANENERLAIMNQAAKASDILSEKMKAQAFNMGINQGQVSGGSIEAHLHFHITPRYMGDSNFMTIFGETRVISEHISASFDKLVTAFNE